MKQTILNRGHIAVVEDQVHQAVAAFVEGQMEACVTILESVQSYITAQLPGWKAEK